MEEDAATVRAMRDFLQELKTAVKRGGKQRVSKMISYPLSFATAKRQFDVRTEQEFVKDYDQIFPKDLKDLLLRQTPECISRVGAKGFTFGSGEIWFDKFPNGEVKIFTITAVVFPDE